MQKNDPTPFASHVEAAEAIIVAFAGDNGANPDDLRDVIPHLIEALVLDDEMPNDYEVLALVGAVPLDGSWPDIEDGADHGCPEDVQLKFPHTDAVIANLF